MEKYANNKLLSACKSTRNYEITELNWTALTSCFIFGNVFAFFFVRFWSYRLENIESETTHVV